MGVGRQGVVGYGRCVDVRCGGRRKWCISYHDPTADRHLVIHRVDEIDVMELGNAAVDATGYFLYSEGILKDYGEEEEDNEGAGEGLR